MKNANYYHILLYRRLLQRSISQFNALIIIFCLLYYFVIISSHGYLVYPRHPIVPNA